MLTFSIWLKTKEGNTKKSKILVSIFFGGEFQKFRNSYLTQFITQNQPQKGFLKNSKNKKVIDDQKNTQNFEILNFSLDRTLKTHMCSESKI